jgi:hypothetical protein
MASFGLPRRRLAIATGSLERAKTGEPRRLSFTGGPVRAGALLAVSKSANALHDRLSGASCTRCTNITSDSYYKIAFIPGIWPDRKTCALYMYAQQVHVPTVLHSREAAAPQRQPAVAVAQPFKQRAGTRASAQRAAAAALSAGSSSSSATTRQQHNSAARAQVQCCTAYALRLHVADVLLVQLAFAPPRMLREQLALSVQNCNTWICHLALTWRIFFACCSLYATFAGTAGAARTCSHNKSSPPRACSVHQQQQQHQQE